MKHAVHIPATRAELEQYANHHRQCLELQAVNQPIPHELSAASGTFNAYIVNTHQIDGPVIADLFLANLEYIDLQLADLTGVNLTETNLYHANLSEANFTDAILANANMEESILHATNFTRAYMRGTIMVRADLTGAIMQSAHMFYAILSEANLTNACMEDTFLSHANLRSTTLLNTNFNRANLTKANMFRVQHIHTTSMENTILIGTYSIPEEIAQLPKEVQASIARVPTLKDIILEAIQKSETTESQTWAHHVTTTPQPSSSRSESCCRIA